MFWGAGVYLVNRSDARLYLGRVRGLLSLVPSAEVVTVRLCGVREGASLVDT